MKHYVNGPSYSTSEKIGPAASKPIDTSFISEAAFAMMSINNKHKNLTEQQARDEKQAMEDKIKENRREVHDAYLQETKEWNSHVREMQRADREYKREQAAISRAEQREQNEKIKERERKYQDYIQSVKDRSAEERRNLNTFDKALAADTKEARASTKRLRGYINDLNSDIRSWKNAAYNSMMDAESQYLQNQEDEE